MNMVKVYIKGQEDKNLSSFLRYYPARKKTLGLMLFLTDKSSMTSRMVTTMQK